MSMKCFAGRTCLALSLAAVPQLAAAATITFDAVPSTGNPIITALTTQGFDFTSGHFHTIDVPLAADNGTIYIAEEGGSLGQPITMAPTGGGVFSLTAIDVGEPLNDASFPNATTFRVVGNLFGGGTVTALFSIDGLFDGAGGIMDFQTFLLPATFINLTSVVFDGLLATGGPGGIGLDNIVVNQTEAVPEPASLLLISIGLGALAARRRHSAH